MNSKLLPNTITRVRNFAPWRLCVRLLIILLFLGSCAVSGKPQTGLDTAVITIAATPPVSVEVELARTEAQRATGLMFRTKLEDGKGMLFIFERDQLMSFWMKDTYIPLSIAYIAYDGTIIDIRDMYPRDTSSVHSSRSVRYALEVPQGWFDRVGVKTGDMVQLP